VKSNINWDGHCMRKFGQSIREQIEVVSNRVLLDTFKARLKAKKQKRTGNTFMVPGLIGRC
jgi:hypothetical protein